MPALSRHHVEAWVRDYVNAWTSYDHDDIQALFTADAEYHEWPYETAWIGRDAIIDGWEARKDWQAGGWTFDWSVVALSGDTAALHGTGVYEQLGRFANIWTVTFASDGRCRVFRMWNNEI